LTTDTREQIRELYSTDGEGYDEVRLKDPRGLLLSTHDRRLFGRMFPASPSSEGELLEIGAGTGRFTQIALERGFSVFATDINETMLNELRKMAAGMGAQDRCRVQIEDVFKLSMEDASYGYAFSFHVIPRFIALDDQRAAIREIGRCLKPGGTFFFNYRNSKSFYNLFYTGHAASPREMEQALADAGLRIVEKRGKWLLNKSVLKKLPLFCGRLTAFFDRLLERFWPDRAWDVFVIAVKD